MAFGTASLGTARKNRRGTQGPRYDCGKYGRLTVAQMRLLSGLSKTAQQKRLDAGWRGERLCPPRYATRSEAISYRAPPRHALLAAFKIADLFPGRVPTIAEIQSVRPMSDRSAGYWRSAIAAVRKEYADRRLREAA